MLSSRVGCFEQGGGSGVLCQQHMFWQEPHCLFKVLVCRTVAATACTDSVPSSNPTALP
jgi:hypothetical protein